MIELGRWGVWEKKIRFGIFVFEVVWNIDIVLIKNVLDRFGFKF